MALSSQSLKSAIVGLWRDRRVSDPNGLPGTARFAQLIRQQSNGEYQTLSTDLRRDLRDTRIGGPKSDLDQYPDGNIAYSAVAVAPKRYLSTRFRIAQRTIDALEGPNAALNLAGDAEDFVAGQILSQHVTSFVAAANDVSTGLVDGSTLDLSDQSTDIVDFFDGLSNDIRLSSTKRPNMVIMSETALRAFRNMDQIQASAAIAGSSSDFRRTNAMPLDAVAAWFRTMLSLELVIEGTTQIGLTGSAEDSIGVNLYLGYCAPMGGCIQTFYQTVGRSGQLIDFDVQEMRHPDPRGLSVAGDAAWEVKVTDRDAGRRVALTLP